ncbi:MAG: diguanylate cyclase (GGDEF)-like protein [Phenylobacterium sp.]|jgi:diguanylate cyclase (GGDEF)-like protein
MLKKTFMLVLSLLSLSTFAMKGATVLLLNSYHPQYKWTDELTRGVKDSLGNNIAAENLHIEFMDARRHVGDQQYQDKLVDLLRYKYLSYRPDVIITSDDHAYYFMIEHGQTLFPDIPIVFCGVNVLFPETLNNRTNITGIKEGMEIEGNLELIQQLQPQVNKVILLGDTTGLGLRMVEQAKLIKSQWLNDPLKQQVSLEIWDSFSLDELHQSAQNMDSQSAFLMLAIHKDKLGNYFSFDSDLPELARISKVPVYGMWGGLMIGNGAIGGLMNNPYKHGQNAAKMALSILDGVPISDLKIKDKASYKPFFDYDQLQKFNINMDFLPPESVVFGKPESVYEQFKTLIHAVIALVIGLSVIISVLLVNIRQRQAAQLKLKQFNAQLESIVHQRTQELEDRNKALEAASQRMEELAKTDILTGLHNRRAAMEEVAAFMRRFNIDYQPLTLVILDIDFFKKINDTHGHQVGDEVLIALAQMLKKTLRPSDRVYRWGGEEFLLALPDTEEALALTVCERLRINIANMDMTDVPQVTVSMGLAGFKNGDSFDAILQLADENLYRAKKQGRNQVVH